MVNPEETAWVFDSLVGFLHGPIWNAPLQTFIEEKSLIFEPCDNEEILNRDDHLSIHEEYKNLVDLMLGSYMEDIGITAEQFEAACEMSKDGGGLPIHFHQRLFDQIWAANDFNIFVKMMTHKNVELQIQALELIERRKGLSQGESDEDREKSLVLTGDIIDDEETAIMEQVKQLSLKETQMDSQTIQENLLTGDEKQPLLDSLVLGNIHVEKENLKQALDTFQHRVVIKEFQDGGQAQGKEGNATPSGTSTNKPARQDLEQRQRYLKEQRDKLLTLKKQIREKQLAENDGDSTLLRPKSSKTARSLLSGNRLASVQDSTLQLRKVLADRLRTEVVEKS